MTGPDETNASDDPRFYDYEHAQRTCDIVMKGGITSGVVYPHAVCELAQTYRLVNVGGTSAGAIAAAAAGAAEAGRPSDGFVKLAKLPDWIASGANLISLFQPQRSTRRLFSILVASLARHSKAKSIAKALLRGYWLPLLLGAVPGLAIVVLAGLFASGAGLVLAVTAGLLVAAGGALAGIAFGACRDLLRIPDNMFGLCSGMGGPKPEALTPWLADQLEDLAGRSDADPPLTFADLEARGVHLELMTTNLTQRRPLRIPWTRPEVFFFDPTELRKLFPERIVTHLEDNPPLSPADGDAQEWMLLCQLLEPLRPLPAPETLPVIVGTRLSLSFPLLLSAVPLWAIDWSRVANQQAMDAWRAWRRAHPVAAIGDAGVPAARPHAERCWFSDGGISSNFPIHFFDAPIPRRPTFAINLRGFHPDYPQSSDERQNVYLPERSVGGLLESWYRYPDDALGRLTGFAESIIRTMQNRVDEAQMRVPGYRDRVVHVATSKSEGGMNLNMPRPVLEALTARGREAGRRLVTRFARPPRERGDLSWDSHRWTRYRSTMAALAALLDKVATAYQAAPEPPGDRTYQQLVARRLDEPPSTYPFERNAQQALATRFTDALIDAANVTAAALPEDLAEGAPKPHPEARIVPRT